MVPFALQIKEQQAQHHLLVHRCRHVLEANFSQLIHFFTVIRKRMLIEGHLIFEVIPVTDLLLRN